MCVGLPFECVISLSPNTQEVLPCVFSPPMTGHRSGVFLIEFKSHKLNSRLDCGVPCPYRSVF
jgi:hypothetical protein